MRMDSRKAEIAVPAATPAAAAATNMIIGRCTMTADSESARLATDIAAAAFVRRLWERRNAAPLRSDLPSFSLLGIPAQLEPDKYNVNNGIMLLFGHRKL